MLEDDEMSVEEQSEFMDLYKIKRRRRKPKDAREKQLQHIVSQLNRLHVIHAFCNETGCTRGEMLFLLQGYDLDIARLHLKARGKPVSSVRAPRLGRELHATEQYAEQRYHWVRYTCGCIEGHDLKVTKICSKHQQAVTHVSNHNSMRSIEGWRTVEQAAQDVADRSKPLPEKKGQRMYAYCENCDWEQDYFFDEEHTPTGIIEGWVKEMLEAGPKKPFSTDPTLIAQYGNLTHQEFCAQKIKDMAESLNNMRWTTYAEFYKDPDKVCPNCQEPVKIDV
jgi:hypothetical protein